MAAVDWTRLLWSEVFLLFLTCCSCVVADVDVEVVAWVSAVRPPSAIAIVGTSMAMAIRPAKNLPLKLPFATFLLLCTDSHLGGVPVQVIRSTMYDVLRSVDKPVYRAIG